MSTAIIIPTWDNFQYLRVTLESILRYTQGNYRLVVIDNGSTDETPQYLSDLKARCLSLTTIRNPENVGFVKAMNQGLSLVNPGEDVLWLNDDIQITDVGWLESMERNLSLDDVGAVGPTSNFVMGLQSMQYSPDLPLRHRANFIIGFCMLVRSDAAQKVGRLDERFGLGGNDDLDYSIRLQEAGYDLLVDRSVFVFHYGARSISRIGGYEKVEAETRPLLVEKWGQARVDQLWQIPAELTNG